METKETAGTLECGHVSSPHDPFTTGYGVASDGARACFACCADRDRVQMRDHGRVTLYLTMGAGIPARLANWPGTLTIPVTHVKVGKHNMAGKRYDVWFTFEGQGWHGVTFGDNTQLCHCRRGRKIAA